MISSIEFHDAHLRFRDSGEGEAVVLVHGYLESLDIWEEFANELAKEYRVIVVDLPGHGESGRLSNIHTMAVKADAIKHVLDHLDIYRAVIVGHSMGGYATLAFAEIYPEETLGFVLFHSHGLPDTEEKKANRDREIELVRAGKKKQIIDTNIPKAFADDNLEKFAKDINYAREIAAGTPDDGIISALEGMKIRPDRQRVLRETTVPVLIIAGKKDNYIPFELAESQFNLAPHHSKLVLENSGHMGFMEEREKSLKGLIKFLEKVY
jgi:pimeloyl-ACP methyl ester carboxylesterase